MKVMIIGGGGREHALAWKIQQSDLVNTVYIAPGNPGTLKEPKCHNVAIAADDIATLKEFALEQDITLTLVGPEIPLALGITNIFNKAGLACFGPNQSAARLESSKAFSKEFLQKYNISTAGYASFDNLAAATLYVTQQAMPIVIKADGLAAGKGVVIAKELQEAIAAIEQLLKISGKIIIEEFIEGEELSYMIITDGNEFLPLASSKDHKALYDGDTGPNTGGMGAYSPSPLLTESLEANIIEAIIKPTLKGLKNEGIQYCGFLYVGLMITATTPKVLEFNCRLGDPETQVLMMRLKSDLVTLCQAALQGSLDQISPSWHEQPALCVVMASQGYPLQYKKNCRINGLETLNNLDLKVFHAGTLLDNDQLITDGGRVLSIAAIGDSLEIARNNAYQAIQHIHFEGAQFRRDIGQHE